MALILLVEDNPLNRELTAELLELGAHEVVQAGSGEEALRLAAGRPPQLILLDISLPGMDGLSMVRQLKTDSTLQSIPVVAVTAHAMKGDQERVLAVGCSGYISKPIDARSFLTQVESYLV